MKPAKQILYRETCPECYNRLEPDGEEALYPWVDGKRVRTVYGEYYFCRTCGELYYVQLKPF